MNDDIPEGLSTLQYGLHILEFSLGFPPVKSNVELMGDCLSGIMKAKGLSGKQAYKYMNRALGLAKEQGITVDTHWLRNGEYMNMRPVKLQASTVNCNGECRSRHGRGYHEKDMGWLWERMRQEIKAGKTINSEALLKELDSKRQDGAPEWRR